MNFQYTNPKFDPPTHGFHFNNARVPWGFGGQNVIVAHQLCGGVVYAALDYFYNGRPIPATTVAPQRHTPLNDYLYLRQKHAHNFTVPAMLGGGLLSLFNEHRGFVHSLATEYNAIRHSILVSNRPVPLFLVKSWERKGYGHHVLVIGCLNDPSEGGAPPFRKPILKVYDPNAPDVESDIRVDYAKKMFYLCPSNVASAPTDMELGSFFVDHNYSQMPNNKLPVEPAAPVPPGAGPAPGPVPPPSPPGPVPPHPRPTGASKTYTVCGGDTLSKIAAVHYGKSNEWPKIYRANQTVIGPNPNLIRIGQVLTIPA